MQESSGFECIDDLKKCENDVCKALLGEKIEKAQNWLGIVTGFERVVLPLFAPLLGHGGKIQGREMMRWCHVTKSGPSKIAHFTYQAFKARG